MRKLFLQSTCLPYLRRSGRQWRVSNSRRNFHNTIRTFDCDGVKSAHDDLGRDIFAEDAFETEFHLVCGLCDRLAPTFRADAARTLFVNVTTTRSSGLMPHRLMRFATRHVNTRVLPVYTTTVRQLSAKCMTGTVSSAHHCLVQRVSASRPQLSRSQLLAVQHSDWPATDH